MFIENAWYVAAWDREVGRQNMLRRTLLDIPVVLYRREDGTPVALENRCAHRNLPLSEGRGEVLGCDLGADRAAVRRRVGLLGHDTALYGELSAAENLDLWARASRVGTAGVPGSLKRLGVPERLWAVPSTRLSAGQRRRVALAAIVVRRPELWLLDEPHAGLDEDGRELVSGLMAEAASAGAAVVLASPETGPADDLATRTVTMAGGAVGVDAG